MGCIYFWERLKIASNKTLAKIRFWGETEIINSILIYKNKAPNHFNRLKNKPTDQSSLIRAVL